MHPGIIYKKQDPDAEVGPKAAIISSKNNAKKLNNLFNNAAKDPITTQIFAGLQNAPVIDFHKEEVQKEKPKVNPFAALEEKNAALNQARLDAARSTKGEVLVKEPKSVPTHIEFVSMAEAEALPGALLAAEKAKNMAALNFRHTMNNPLGTAGAKKKPAPEIKKK